MPDDSNLIFWISNPPYLYVVHSSVLLPARTDLKYSFRFFKCLEYVQYFPTIGPCLKSVLRREVLPEKKKEIPSISSAWTKVPKTQFVAYVYIYLYICTTIQIVVLSICAWCVFPYSNSEWQVVLKLLCGGQNER